MNLTLKELRKSAGLSQKEVASRLGITQAGASRIELMNNMRISTLRDFVRACGRELVLTVRLPDGTAYNLKLGE